MSNHKKDTIRAVTRSTTSSKYPFCFSATHVAEGKETLSAALHSAQQVAHSVGEKLGLVSPIEEKKEEFQEGNTFVQPSDLETAKSHLKHAETHDKSKPVIDSKVHIKENHHKELLQEIGQSHDLKHAETHDTSAPHIDKTIHIKEAPQKQIFAEISKPHDLKHVETDDKSKPVIPKNIHVEVRK